MTEFASVRLDVAFSAPVGENKKSPKVVMTKGLSFSNTRISAPLYVVVIYYRLNPDALAVQVLYVFS